MAINDIDAARLAAEMVKAALAAGWLEDEDSGTDLGNKVGDAIEAIAARLVKIT